MSEVAEILKRLQRENQEAREKFAGLQSRIIGAVLNGDDIADLVNELAGSHKESGAESLEARNADSTDRSARTAGPPENEHQESGSGEQGSPPEAVGQ